MATARPGQSRLWLPPKPCLPACLSVYPGVLAEESNNFPLQGILGEGGRGRLRFPPSKPEQLTAQDHLVTGNYPCGLPVLSLEPAPNRSSVRVCGKSKLKLV